MSEAKKLSRSCLVPLWAALRRPVPSLSSASLGKIRQDSGRTMTDSSFTIGTHMSLQKCHLLAQPWGREDGPVLSLFNK